MNVHPLVAHQRAQEAMRLIQRGECEVGFGLLLDLLKADPHNRCANRALVTLAIRGELKFLQLGAFTRDAPGFTRCGKFIRADWPGRKTRAQ
ncbi:MAG: hypothetical protein GYA48_14675 [Chloroflexi bacterium]|nr:hypothetical protein [Chloroflexota bacterium]